MKKDLFYVFDKNTGVSSVLGETQSDFNMSFVIDGTKDSCSITILSYVDYEIEPYTICWHEKTNTWWVVSKDKIERYQNESGFVWIHELELLGAIELLNARDLTDCGFNDRTYTVGEFILRLFSLTNFEYNYNSEYFFLASNNFLYQKVDFIKTFENYTLLSALREFLDAYNMCAKLIFSCEYDSLTQKYTIEYPQLQIIPKTGDGGIGNYDIEDFDESRETKTIGKESFGTSVVSNAENVISCISKTYPSTSSVRLGSKQYQVVKGTTLNDAVIRLPSKVYKGNWLKIIYPVGVTLFIQGNTTHSFTYHYLRTQVSYEKLITFFEQKIFQDTGSQELADIFSGYMDESTKEILDLASCVTLYDGNNINAYTGEIVKGENVPYLTEFYFKDTYKKVIFTDIDTKNSLKDIKQGIAWERGSNLITGFEMFSGGDLLQVRYSDYHGNYTLFSFTSSGITISLTVSPYTLKHVSTNTDDLATQLSKLSFIVNYIPMTDLKVKVDNQRDKRDIQLYNQNGKLVDCVALSKLINSYAKEISSDNIVRYMHYTNGDIPKVGSFVNTTNGLYVINNVSMTYTQCESQTANEFNYYVDCEFSMSKYVSTKSLLVNPNTNIRDYGIPQNFNVKRKQLYRDYYDITYVRDVGATETPYLIANNIFNFTTEPNTLPEFICVMKLTYDESIGGDGNDFDPSNKWYYQLETTQYQLNKMLYVVCDFNDNNTIGYDAQNVFSGFDISRVFNGFTDNISTPITYTDNNGKVQAIDLLFMTNNTLAEIYEDYQDYRGGSSWDGSLYNYSVFIPEDIYNAALLEYSIRINETHYHKDALEVPVFEYVCQIGDSQDVIIGDNILTQHDGYIYFYTYIQGENLTEYNALDDQTMHIISGTTYELEDTCEIEYSDSVSYGKQLKVRTYAKTTYYEPQNTWSYAIPSSDIQENKDMAVFRHAYNIETGDEIVELMFIAKNIPTPSVGGNLLTLNINYYKLK